MLILNSKNSSVTTYLSISNLAHLKVWAFIKW
jgi:hypothetical protein